MCCELLAYLFILGATRSSGSAGSIDRRKINFRSAALKFPNFVMPAEFVPRFPVLMTMQWRVHFSRRLH